MNTDPSLVAVDVDGLPDEVLNLISVGAHALMGGTPSEDWGQHTGDPVDEEAIYADDCRTCRATQWFDAAQAEMRRRETE